MKKKSMILAVASLGSMAIIGTGFAGWVISADATATASGVMVAYDVVDQRLKAEEGTWTRADKNGNGQIIFGKPATESANDPWLTCEEMEAEALENTYRFTVKSNNSEDAGTITVSKATDWFELSEDDQAKWTGVTVTKKMIAAEPEIDFGGTNGAYTLTGGSAIITVNVKFSWGEAFGKDNPFNYYNKTPKSSVDSKTMDTAAETIHQLFNVAGINFKLHFDIKR